jgi:hypothetical protein
MEQILNVFEKEDRYEPEFLAYLIKKALRKINHISQGSYPGLYGLVSLTESLFDEFKSTCNGKNKQTNFGYWFNGENPGIEMWFDIECENYRKQKERGALELEN